MKNFKGRSIIGLMLLYIAVFLNWQWVWGILFLLWVIPDLFTGITYFLEPVECKSNPFIYWAIMVSWIWMAIYMIAMPYVPQLQAGNGEAIYKSQSTGVYQADSINQTNQSTKLKSGKAKEIILNKENEIKMDKPKSVKPVEKESSKKPVQVSKKETLDYATSQTTTQYFIGISETFNAQDPDLEKHMTQLWEYFYQNDISQAIPNIIDEKIYVVYSDYDLVNQGDYKMTIGFQTNNLNNIYEGLTGVKISPAKVVVFEQNGKDATTFVSETWEKIYKSDLNINNTFALETYELDQNYDIKKSMLQVAIK